MAGAARCLHRPLVLTKRALARQGTVVFDIDGEKWTLDLRPGQRKVTQGAPEGKPDLTLTISDDNFVKLVSGKMGPQQARACSSPNSSLVQGIFDQGISDTGCGKMGPQQVRSNSTALARGTSRMRHLLRGQPLHDNTKLSTACVV